MTLTTIALAIFAVVRVLMPVNQVESLAPSKFPANPATHDSYLKREPAVIHKAKGRKGNIMWDYQLGNHENQVRLQSEDWIRQRSK